MLSVDGQILQSRGDVALPVTDAIGRRRPRATVGDLKDPVHRRHPVPHRHGLAGPGQRRAHGGPDWSENAAVLRQLATVLSVLAAALAVVAAVIGWLVARRITGPLIRLTQTAEQISSTGQVPQTSRDEVGRLAGAGRRGRTARGILQRDVATPGPFPGRAAAPRAGRGPRVANALTSCARTSAFWNGSTNSARGSRQSARRPQG